MKVLDVKKIVFSAVLLVMSLTLVAQQKSANPQQHPSVQEQQQHVEHDALEILRGGYYCPLAALSVATRAMRHNSLFILPNPSASR